MSTGALRRSGQLARTRLQRPQSMGSSDALRVQPNYSNDLIQNSLSQQVNSRVFRLLEGAGRGFAWAVLFRLTRKTPYAKEILFEHSPFRLWMHRLIASLWGKPVIKPLLNRRSTKKDQKDQRKTWQKGNWLGPFGWSRLLCIGKCTWQLIRWAKYHTFN